MADEQPQDAGPVPLSFPAILRNPGLSDRFADPPQSLQRRAKKDRPEPEGKRWARRRENGAPHRTPSPPRLTHPQPGSRTTHTSPSHPPSTLPTHSRSPRPPFHIPYRPTCPAPFPFPPLALLPPSHILRWPLLPLFAWRPPYPPRPPFLCQPCESHRDPPRSMAPRWNILEPRSSKGSPLLSWRRSRRQGRHQGSR